MRPNDVEERIGDIREGARGVFWEEVLAWVERQSIDVLTSFAQETDTVKLFRLQGELRVLQRFKRLPDELVERAQGRKG